ncbi:MAG TPA: sulfatase [Victivallales bacterium]|nr:sulfatase [Victivallales bacterium]
MYNIIYIHTHDTGRYIQPYGYGIPTPRLMEMAQEGVLFRNYHTTGPTCSPSRSSLLSGMAPHSIGMLGLAHRGFEWNDYSKHLANYLRKNGYETALCNVQHEVSHKRIDALGYERILKAELKSRLDDEGLNLIERDKAHCEEAVKFIKSTHQKPFFLSFGMISTHRPFPCNSKINPDYLFVPAKIPDAREIRKDMAGFAEMLTAVDECTGKILDAIKESGLDKNTIVIFTTDHGIAFPFHKCNLYDTGTGISLIIKFPDKKYAGKTVDSLLSVIDIFPTLCDINGLEKPSWLEGKSFLSILEGKENEINEEIYAEITYHAAYEPVRSIRTKRYKLIRHFDDYEKIVLPNIDNGLTKAYLMERGLAERKKDMIEFFDLINDPEEKRNLALIGEKQNIMNELNLKLENWMKRTNDPILTGYVPKPKGAIANRKDGIHPEDEDYE